MNDVNDHALKVDERYVWVGTRRGLSRYDKVTESWTSFTKPDTLSENEVFAVTASRDRKLRTEISTYCLNGVNCCDFIFV